MALSRVWIPSPNYSSRGGAGVRLIVIHSSEGAQTLESLGGFFKGNVQASSQVGIDNVKRGRIGEYVQRSNKSWTQASYNPVATSAELCTPSGASTSWSNQTWRSKDVMLANCAEWIAEEARKFGIPITKLTPSQAQGGGKGVCQHRDLGSGGGNHHDCGTGFPIDYVLDLARGKKPSGGTAPPKGPDYRLMEAPPMQLVFSTGKPGEAPAATLVIPNFYADGKARYRFGCAEKTSFRVDMMGHGKTATISLDGSADGVGIPKGCKAITVRRDSGSAPIDAVLSKD
jgi:hypothetical protein